MPLSREQLRQISAATLAHYDERAQAFWEGTRDHDVSQNIAALLRHVEADPPFELLDFGCGPGRDLIEFSRLGHHVVGLDGSVELAALARANSGCEVLVQNIFSPQLPAARFDGIFANAVLFHVPNQLLHGVLLALRNCLKPGGVLFSSNPRGEGQEGWIGNRYGVYHDWPGWQRQLLAAGFVEIEHYYRPTGVPFEQQNWLASVWRVPAAA